MTSDQYIRRLVLFDITRISAFLVILAMFMFNIPRWLVVSLPGLTKSSIVFDQRHGFFKHPNGALSLIPVEGDTKVFGVAHYRIVRMKYGPLLFPSLNASLFETVQVLPLSPVSIGIVGSSKGSIETLKHHAGFYVRFLDGAVIPETTVLSRGKVWQILMYGHPVYAITSSVVLIALAFVLRPRLLAAASRGRNGLCVRCCYPIGNQICSECGLQTMRYHA